MKLSRAYTQTAPDPIALAKAYGIPFDNVAVRVGVTTRWAREMARHPRHVARVRRAVLELALENERLEALLA